MKHTCKIMIYHKEFTIVVPLFAANRAVSAISPSSGFERLKGEKNLTLARAEKLSLFSEMETTLVHLAQGLPGTMTGGWDLMKDVC